VAPRRILVDTGPLVAMLRPDDAHFQTCVDEARSLPYPFLTSWPVITEAAWLLRTTADGTSKLLEQIERGLILPLDLDAHAAPWIRTFVEKYRDLGTQLADASLCYLAERERIDSIFTLDRRDFAVYRTRENRAFMLVPARI
jgi:predicted nucleic acid-binding protein